MELNAFPYNIVTYGDLANAKYYKHSTMLLIHYGLVSTDEQEENESKDQMNWHKSTSIQ